MTTINGNFISLTRGDTLRLKVGITVNGAEYTPVSGDVVRFAAKHDIFNGAKSDFSDRKPVISKTIPNNTLILTLDPADTKLLGFGRYAYDVQITFADGTTDTFISDYLVLTKEVD